MSELRKFTTEGLIEELERRKVSFDKYKELGKFEKFQEEANELLRRNDRLWDALKWAAPYAKDDPRVSKIVEAALKDKT